ncbi:DUF1211 domain-containing protein [Lactiplantibacillus plantarum]|nr:DUF1211 domain-containing protein [Lactiplantibacillus plantarum]
MNKARLEAFTDAIIAIVLTLLVLDLPRPQTPSVRALFAKWQSIYVYIITFTLLISIWLNHHDLFVQVKKSIGLFFGRIVSGCYVSLLFHSWPHGLLNFRIQNGPQYFIFLRVLFGCWLISY